MSNYSIAHYYFHSSIVSFTTQKEYKWAILQFCSCLQFLQVKHHHLLINIYLLSKIHSKPQDQMAKYCLFQNYLKKICKSSGPIFSFPLLHFTASKPFPRQKSRRFSARHYIWETDPRVWGRAQFSLDTTLLNQPTWSAEAAGPGKEQQPKGRALGAEEGSHSPGSLPAAPATPSSGSKSWGCLWKRLALEIVHRCQDEHEAETGSSEE